MSDTSKIKKGSALEPDQTFSSSNDELKNEINDSEETSNGVISDQEDEISNKAQNTDKKDKNEAKLGEKLSEAEGEVKKNFELMLRAKAELENYKKRTVREMNDIRKYATESLMRELLIVVDNLERAIESSDDNAKSTLEGVNLTLDEMIKILRKYNVTPIKSIGTIFDPKIHQAMSQEETSNHPKNTVVKEFLKGYLLHDRLLRPAMVVVSKELKKENS